MNTSVMGEEVGRVAFKSRDVSQCMGGDLPKMDNLIHSRDAPEHA